MSVARPSKCLFCTFRQATKPRVPSTARRRFHVSPPKRQNDSKSGKWEPHELDSIKPLPAEEIEKDFTPTQQRAVKDTQSHLKFDDEYQRTTAKNLGPWRMEYTQDMTEVDPVLDKPVRQPWTNLDDNSRLKTDDELDEDIVKFMMNMPENQDQAEDALQKFLDTNRITIGKETAEFSPRTAMAPDNSQVFKEDAVSKEQQKQKRDRKKPGADASEEVSPALVRLMQMTGMSQQQIASLRVKSIISHRVVNQTRLGKIQKQYWLSVAGNQNGLLGIGEGKSEEAAEGLVQSQYRAIRNMVPIMRYENRTTFGDIKGKVGATELELSARPPGFGLRCQHHIWEMCRCAGITDLAARVTRARNPMNTVKAAFQALLSQKDPEEIAKGRGKKMVDVRKVYYAGNV